MTEQSAKSINRYGDIYWRLPNRNLHREGGPAVEYINGTKYWFINGLVHREGAPAIEYGNGRKEWWIHGLKHKTDGPAIEWANGAKEWWVDGKFIYREDPND